MKAQLVTTRIITAAQWAWNAAMAANPIGLVIFAIAALIGIIVVVIQKWNEWGAAVSLFLGPLGMVISLVQSFRRNWDGIAQAFKEGGIVAGLKAIGKTLFDAVLMPMQQVAKLIADFTGIESFRNAEKLIAFARKQLEVNVTTDENGQPISTPILNPEAERQTALRETIMTQRQNVAIDIRDQTGRATMQSDNDLIPIKLSSTMGF
jgi:ABC-type multidrug transport system fused ATPase/permease subunit